MPDIVAPAAETLNLAEHAVHDVHVRDTFVLDLSEDFQVFDGLAPASYTQEGSRELNDHGIISPANVSTYTIPDALRREIFERDLELRPSLAKISDCKFEVPVEQLPVNPKEGDKLLFDGINYRVMGWEKSTLSTRWRLWVRAAR